MKNRHLGPLVLIAVCAGLLSACAAERHIERKAHERKYQPPCEADTKRTSGSNSSLFNDSLARLYVDQRAYQVCDVVTVMIQEKSSAAGSAAHQ